MALGGGLADKVQGENDGGDNDVANPRRITIIGAGMAGLAAAYQLTRNGVFEDQNTQVLLLERGSRGGGSVSTYELEDYTLELGPDMFQTEKPEAINLCHELGLSEFIVPTNSECNRSYIAFGGQLHANPEGFQLIAPTNMPAFFSSSLMTMGGKMRMAMDMVMPKKAEKSDESLASFVRRRFGSEALERVAQPMMGGIYTADPEQLSLEATMPRFLDLEQKYGSVIRGLMAEKKSPPTKESGDDDSPKYSKFVSLQRGLGMLVERILTALPTDTVHFHCPVIAVEKGKHGKAWDVIVANGTVVPSDTVIMACPAFASADMMAAVDSEISAALRRIQYASCAVMNLIYNRADIPHPLDGFGFVVPAVEKRTILACSFASQKFPGRCPKEKAVLRIFVGGALQQDVFEMTDEQIECCMWEDLHSYLGLKSVPLLSLITRYPRAMPQYHVGHVDLISQVRTRLASSPGLYLAGNAYDGVGIPDCIRSGQTAAKQAIEAAKAARTET